MPTIFVRALVHDRVGGERPVLSGTRGAKLTILGIDHIVLCVTNVAETRNFYAELLGLEAREERPGKWALHFGDQKISLQAEVGLPELAVGTLPGSGNFCLISSTPVERLVEALASRGIEVLAGPDERIGAVGRLRSVYFRDPDGNLVEVSNRIPE